jgi:acylaminoacyl-peptidase
MLGCDTFIHVALSCSVGGKLPFEAIFVSYDDSSHSPTVVILHGGPHSVSVSSYVKSSGFLASLGFNLLIVNYRYDYWNFSAPL